MATFANSCGVSTRPYVRNVRSRSPCSTLPPGIWTFCACSAAVSCAVVRPTDVSFSVSTTTLICRGRPPTMSACPTPSIDSRRRRSFLSANSVTSRIGAGPDSAIDRTGIESGSNFWMIGGSASFGRSRRMVFTRSRTSCAAMSASFSRTNCTVTCDTPSDEIDCSWSIPLMVLTASSILSVMSVSISSGAAPTRRVLMTMVGKSTFGKRSTPSCW